MRELKAVVACAAALAGSAGGGNDRRRRTWRSRATETPPKPEHALAGTGNLAEAVANLERRMIAAALAAEGGNRSAAARRLGLSRVGLIKMMARLGVK